MSGPVPQATAVPQRPPPAMPPRLSDLWDSPAAGSVAGAPFLMRSAILWNDTEAAWISLNPYVPATAQRFDPRAREKAAAHFLIDLDTFALRPGSWTLTAPGGPVRGVALSIPGRAAVRDGWALALRIDRVVVRHGADGHDAYNVAGALALRLRNPDAWIDGAFLAHDVLRDDEVPRGEPTVATPVP